MMTSNQTIVVVVLILFVVGIAIACRPAADGTNSSGESQMLENTNVSYVIDVSPLTFASSDEDVFTISVTATNDGEETASPRADLIELFVNGKRSNSWSLTISNGAREKKWSELPAGESISIAWSTLSKSLFDGAGDYNLEFKLGDQTLQTAEVQVE